ncbi:MAG: FG-GAP repeat domain-containing protein, partial [Planctomycetota bacterium]
MNVLRHRDRAASLLALLAVACASRERYLSRLEVVREVDARVGAWKGEAARLAAAPGERIEWTEVELLDADARLAPIPARARVTSGIARPDGSRATREQTFEIELRRSALDGRLDLAAERETGRTEEALPSPWFEDVTEAARLLDRHRPSSRAAGSNRIVRGESPASGAAALDYDGDGWTDLFCADGVASVLYRNRGDGTFAERTEAAGLGLATGNGVASADVDGDGRADLVALDHFAPARLLRNRGGRFADATAGARLRVEGRATSAAFADVDSDGD